MYRPQSRDAQPWAEELLFQQWRGMSPLEKARLLTQLCQSLHRLTLAGLEARYPDADEEELELRAAALRLGPELMARVSGPPSE